MSIIIIMSCHRIMDFGQGTKRPRQCKKETKNTELINKAAERLPNILNSCRLCYLSTSWPLMNARSATGLKNSTCYK